MGEIIEIENMHYDKGKKTLVKDFLPYGDIVKGAGKATYQASGDKQLASILIPGGQQLKLLFLRLWTQTPAGAIFEIVQTAQTGDLGSSPPGGIHHPTVTSAHIDYPMLEAAGAEVLGPQPLEAPIHVLEGSVDLYIQDAVASPYYYGWAYWGVVQ
jgi:hypothetical protein